MNLSMNWLSDYVKVNCTPKEYAEALTMSGSKVEGYSIIGDDIENVKVGKITKIEKHPDSDHLLICQVDVGEDADVQIVTGAQNVFEGALVPCALHKSTLPGGVKITKGKLRGVDSFGMMCSIGELGLTVNDYPGSIDDGILILNDGEIGADIRDVLGLHDTVVEFEITSNRPDCLSILGLARETAATYRKELTLPDLSFSEKGGDINSEISVENKEPTLCKRYSCRVVKNVKIGPSPMWLRNRLRACGVRPINNIVDITNYVMLEYGQPLHAFDKRFIKGDKIIVRRAADGEKITTLDGIEYSLTPDNLVIADTEKPVAVAGVMGGEYSGIMDDTTTVVFESASFDGFSVRKTAQKLGFRTESSARFEKGLNPEITEDALHRAVSLAEQLADGEICKGEIDIFPTPTEIKPVSFDPDYINKFIGINVSKEEMVKMLASLDMEIENGCILPPIWRIDIGCKADVAEEIARLYGYNNIPTTPLSGLADGGYTPKQSFENKLNELSLGLGYTEIQTYSFISPKYYDNIMLPADSPFRKSVVITNPLGEDTSVMRTTTIPSMMEILSRNYKNRAESAALYEMGKEYIPNDDQTLLPDEIDVLTFGRFGNSDFYTLKGTIEAVLSAVKVADITYKTCNTRQTFHPGRCAEVYSGETLIGYFGEIYPEVCENYGMKTKAYVGKIYIEALRSCSPENLVYTPLPRFPSATRDLSLVCNDDVTAGEIEKVIKENGGALLEKVKLFDVFKGEQLGAGKKSISFNLILRSKEGTITDSDADKVTNKILTALEKINIEIRK